VLQVVPALAINYLGSFEDPHPWADAYIAIMMWVWLFWVVALAAVAWRIARRRASPRRSRLRWSRCAAAATRWR